MKLDGVEKAARTNLSGKKNKKIFSKKIKKIVSGGQWCKPPTYVSLLEEKKMHFWLKIALFYNEQYNDTYIPNDFYIVITWMD